MGFPTFFKENIIRRDTRKKPKAEHLVNRAIPFSKVFVLGVDGEKLGVLTKKDAIYKAEALGLDLVVISNNPKQPIAKILDYGKWKYDRKKKQKEAKLKQTTISNREVRLTPMIGTHDLMTKSKKAREFLLNGDRVKVSLKFRGRELARKDLGYDKIKEFYATVEDIAMIQKEPTLNGGRFLDMYLTIDKKKAPTKEKQDAKDEN